MDEQQRTAILDLISQGALDSKDIAKQVGVTPSVVAAVKAHRTMGRYDDEMSIESAQELIEAGDIAFGLEREMQAALRCNVPQLEPGLVVIDGGKERNTAAGFIDITARDSSGKTVVIELKAGQAKPEALTQILAYVGSLQDEEGQAPRAILVAHGFHKKVLLAARTIPGLELVKYGLKFEFERC